MAQSVRSLHGGIPLFSAAAGLLAVGRLHRPSGQGFPELLEDHASVSHHRLAGLLYGVEPGDIAAHKSDVGVGESCP